MSQMPHNPLHSQAAALARRIAALPVPDTDHPEFELQHRLRAVQVLQDFDVHAITMDGADFTALWRMDEVLERYHSGADCQPDWSPVAWPARAPAKIVIDPPSRAWEGMSTVAVLVDRYDNTQMTFVTVSIADTRDGSAAGNELVLDAHCLDLETGAITDDGTQCTQQEWETMGPAWANLYGALARHPAIAAT